MSGFCYRVKSKENVFDVAKKFDVLPTYLIFINQLSKDIEQGDLLYIDERNKKKYRIKAEDSVDSLCEKFSITKNELLYDNGLKYLIVGIFIYV